MPSNTDGVIETMGNYAEIGGDVFLSEMKAELYGLSLAAGQCLVEQLPVDSVNSHRSDDDGWTIVTGRVRGGGTAYNPALMRYYCIYRSGYGEPLSFELANPVTP